MTDFKSNILFNFNRNNIYGQTKWISRWYLIRYFLFPIVVKDESVMRNFFQALTFVLCLKRDSKTYIHETDTKSIEI